LRTSNTYSETVEQNRADESHDKSDPTEFLSQFHAVVPSVFYFNIFANHNYGFLQSLS